SPRTPPATRRRKTRCRPSCSRPPAPSPEPARHDLPEPRITHLQERPEPMALGTGGILVTFESIQRASSDVANTVRRTEANLEQLRADLAPMVATWEGGASTDYQVLQRRWDQAAADLRDTLQQISAHLLRSYES